MNITIERAAPSDAAAVLEYLKQVGGETDNLTFGAEGLPFSVEDEAARIAGMAGSRDHLMMLVKADGRIIGDASLHRQPRRMCHRGDLGISVAKAYWNRGVGSRLLQAVLDFARENGFQVIDLQVRSDNLPAIHLYEKFGFVKLGTHPAFFRMDGQDIPFDFMCLQLG